MLEGYKRPIRSPPFNRLPRCLQRTRPSRAKAVYMTLRIAILIIIVTSNLRALDLKFSCEGKQLIIPQHAVQFVYTNEGRIRIGTSIGIFEVTPDQRIDPDAGPVDCLEALNRAIDDLLGAQQPLDDSAELAKIGDALKQVRGTKYADQLPRVPVWHESVAIRLGGVIRCKDIWLANLEKKPNHTQ